MCATELSTEGFRTRLSHAALVDGALLARKPPGGRVGRALLAPLVTRFGARQRRSQEIVMSIGTFVIVGLLAGFIASKFIIKTGDGLLRDLGLGIAGAVIGGWLFRALSATEATGIDVFGLVVTFAGASAALIAYHAFFMRIPETKPATRTTRK